ncbi:thioredoxin [Acetobacter pasteurianus]|uniref:Thioredoxin n=1 Tax=Lodderomyces elongisporus (strain ATCC 11503 / CBS 2605 / JCM 1781 / NBRC 1676 / NRRL YB-4239) TaxID=379508 RepID=A5E6L2_LODEL|nr:conserved hypothetical protein [Lodderomyces elongisporus NRRL YB-4239]MDC6270699.1 thioredoxin [Acetobacter pasteurianus]
MITNITSKALFQGALSFKGLVVVDFFATWCGPCKMISPLLEKFSNEYKQVKFLKVDVDQSPEIALAYQVSSMPTFLFFKNGEQIHKVVGANPSALKQAIDSNA